MAFSLWTWACDQLVLVSGSLKTRHLNELLLLIPWYSQVTLVSGYPFWQLSIDHDMDFHKDVHYQVKQIVYTLDT